MNRSETRKLLAAQGLAQSAAVIIEPAPVDRRLPENVMLRQLQDKLREAERDVQMLRNMIHAERLRLRR